MKNRQKLDKNTIKRQKINQKSRKNVSEYVEIELKLKKIVENRRKSFKKLIKTSRKY